MNKNQKWVALFVALFLLATGTFFAVWANHDEHKEWRWHEKIFDWDDDQDHPDKSGEEKEGK